MQDCTTAVSSSNLDVLRKKDKKECKGIDRSEDGNDDDYYNDDFNENNHPSDIDVSDTIYASNGEHSNDDSSDGHNSNDSGSTESAISDQDPNHDEVEFHFENDKEKEVYLIKMLRIWALESGLLSMRKLNSLLAKLKPLFPNIPLSYKTLLDTPSSIQIIHINRGQLWYKSITANLNSMNLENYLKFYGKIVIDVNVDGLPLFKSSREHFWPLLGRLVGATNQPFVISLSLFRSAVVPDLH